MTLQLKNGLVFDTGPLIGMTMNNLTWVLEKLKNHYPGNFYITPGVKYELIDRPLQTHKYKFESIRMLPYLANDTITLLTNEKILNLAEEILELSNNTFFSKGHPIKIVHQGEAEAAAACIIYKCKTLVIDERTMRYLIEAPTKIKQRLQRKLHSKIKIDHKKLNELKGMLKEIQPIRSTELLVVAYEKGMLDYYERSNIDGRPEAEFKKSILEGVLWALKLSGCAIYDKEIDIMLKDSIQK
jgi:hypothetical protein